jgi:hypothetical protein
MRPCQGWWRLFRYHPDDEKRVHEGLKAYLDGNGAHWEVEYRLHHASRTAGAGSASAGRAA